MRVNWTALAILAAALAAGCGLAVAVLAADVPTARLAAAGWAAGLIAAFCAALAVRRAARDAATVSREVTALSRRLIRLESRTTDESGPSPERIASLAAGVAGDLEALTRVVSRLAESIGRQDGRLTNLERPPARDVPVVVEAPPAAEDPTPVAPALTTREDFARAASAILRRLTPTAQPPAPDIVLDRLEAGLVELFLQPVVTLPQRRTAFYTALPHLRDEGGTPIGPAACRTALARHGRLPRLDAFVLAQGLSVCSFLGTRDREAGVSLRLSRQSLGEAAFLEGASVLLGENREAASRLILEIDHAEAERLSAPERAGLHRLRGFGVQLAAEGVPDLDWDWPDLARQGFSHATVPAATVLAPRPHLVTARLVAAVGAAGLRLVAGEVDEEPLIPDLLDFDVPFARGMAVAPPRPVRAEVVAPSAPTAAAERAPETSTSFRDFLRRAG